ncbi:MAG: hypothetical protein GTO22_05410, partial [Gemmatimonadales bacterium]|nr:hypothetical protein [Gemmatimonadales bacterium]
MPEIIEISSLGQEDSKSSGGTSQALTVLGILGGLALLGWLTKTYLRPGVRAAGIPSRSSFLVPGLEDMDDLGVIVPCKPEDRDPKRPAKDQRWCLWTRDKKR